MIHKITDDWSKAEGDMRQTTKGESEELQRVLDQIVGVRDLLKRMCQVSVTRTTLKNAVREALLPVIREHRDELFPELVELREKLKAAGEDPGALSILAGGATPSAGSESFQRKLDDFEQRVRKLSSLEESFRTEFAQLDGRLSEGEDRLSALRDFCGAEFESGKLAVDEKVQKVQEDLGRLEETIPETAHRAAGAVEERLRKEIQNMVQELSGKLKELHETMARIESVLPGREAIVALDRRLERLESCFVRMSEQVGSIDSVTPEIRSLGDRFTSLRAQIADVSADLERTGKGVKEIQQAFGSRLEELQGVLKDGITRWESDQSQMQERLTALRDTLRDQLQAFGRQVEAKEGSFWGKLTGKKDAGLKLSGQEFEDLGAKLESIIGGLEGIIAKKK